MKLKMFFVFVVGIGIGGFINQQTIYNRISNYFVSSNHDKNTLICQLPIDKDNQDFYGSKTSYHEIFANLVLLSTKKNIQIDSNKIRKILLYDADSIENLINKYDWEMVQATGRFTARGFLAKPNNYVNLKDNHYLEIITLVNKYVETNVLYLNNLGVKYKAIEIEDNNKVSDEYFLLYKLSSVDLISLEKHGSNIDNILKETNLLQAHFLMQQQKSRLLNKQYKFFNILITKMTEQLLQK